MRIVWEASRKKRRIVRSAILLFLAVSSVFAAGTEKITILQKSPRSLLVRVEWPLPASPANSEPGPEILVIDSTYSPVQALLLTTDNEPVSVEMIEQKLVPVRFSRDMQPQETLYSDPNIAPLGRFRGRRLWSLRFSALVRNGAGVVSLRRSAVLRIHFRRAGTERVRFLGADSAALPDLLRSAPPRRMKQGVKVAAASEEANLAQVKILVDRDGIYRISYEQLKELGAEIPADLDSWQLRLQTQGRDVPIYVEDHHDGKFGPGDALEFYGQFSRAEPSPQSPDVYLDPYSVENVYWLSWGQGSGQRLIEEEALVLETDPRNYHRVYSFPAKIHFEYDRHYDRLGRYQKQEPRDHWFLDSGVFSGEKREYLLPIIDPDTQSDQPVALRVMLHGQTYADTLPHRVEVFFNERIAAAGEWWGQTPFLLRDDPLQPIPANLLDSRRNSITVVNRAPVTAVDNFYVNWVEVTYPRLLRAHKDYLEFTIPPQEGAGLFDFEISDFTSDQISLYKLGSSKMVGADISPEGVTDEEDTTFVLHFQDEVFTTNVRYVAVAEQAKLQPKAMLLHTPVDLRHPAESPDYLIIVADSLRDAEALQKLVQHREKQGHQVMVAAASDVFNQFSHGLFSPYGIQNFLRYAYFNWPSPPRYVLLVGDGSYDNRNLRRGGTNLLPVFLRQMAKYGAALSDHWYTLMDDDELPDLYLGRLPVNTPDELQIVVDKIIEYEEALEIGPWLNRMLLVAGNGSVFRKQSETLIREVLPTRLEIHRLYAWRNPSVQEDPFFGGTTDLVEHINDGVALINFMGHGGGAIWADNSLMRLEDVERLHNKSRYPIITSMTCFTGAFDNPFRQTLAEKMLLQPDAGSPAIWASSGLGWTREDFNIVRELFDLFAEYGSSLTLGEALAAAKLRYISKHLDAVGFSILNQYNLLGDPAMRLRLPDSGVQWEAPGNFAQRGDSLAVAGRAQVGNGEGVAQLIDENRVVRQEVPLQVNGGAFSARLFAADTLPGDQIWVRVYLRSEDGSAQFSDARPVSLNFLRVDSLKSTVAGARAEIDSIYFQAWVRHAKPLALAEIEIMLPEAARVPLDSLGEELYRSRFGLRPLRAGEVVRYRIHLRDTAGHEYRSVPVDDGLPRGVDLKVQAEYTSLEASDSIQIVAAAFNIGDEDAPAAEVLFESLRDDGWKILGRDTVTIPAKDRRFARVSVAPIPGERHVRVRIDPQNRIAEISENNNIAEATLYTNLFPVTARYGTTLNYSQNDTIRFDDHLRLFAPPGAVAQNLVVRVERIDSLDLRFQPDFHPVRAEGGPVAYRIEATDSAAVAFPQIDVIFPADSLAGSGGSIRGAMQGGDLAVCRFDQTSERWIRLASARNAEVLTASLGGPGQVGLFEITDRTPPSLEFTVSGQLFSDGGYVPANPVFGLLAADLNGVDRSPESIKIWLDETPLPYSEVTFVDSAAQYNATAMMFRPHLDAGEHFLRARVRDAAGNESAELERVFKVADASRLVFLGNYPNPFENRTTFAFELTDFARDLELKIYTTSGHLIRTIRAEDVVEDPNPLGPNYHEITWDGRDAFGERVGNGLYFFKLRVKFEDTAREVVGRVARLK